MSSPSPRRPDRSGPGSPSGAPELPPALPEPRARALLAFHSALLDALARPAEQGRLFRVIAREAAALAGASCAVFTLEADDGVLRGRAGAGALAAQEGELLPVEGSLEGQAVRSGEPARTADLRGDPRGYRGAERGLPGGPALAVPLAGANGVAGVLLFARVPGDDPFGAEDEACARRAAEAAAAAVEGALAFERARGSAAALERWRADRAAAAEGGRRLLRALRHELNNPLAAVLGHAQLLEADPAVRALPHVLPSVHAIRDEARRIDRFTRRLAELESSDDPRLLDDDGLPRLALDEGEEAREPSG